MLKRFQAASRIQFKGSLKMKWSIGGVPTNSRHSIGSLKRSSA
ncbi:hypothetical protein [Kingella oralis]